MRCAVTALRSRWAGAGRVVGPARVALAALAQEGHRPGVQPPALRRSAGRCRCSSRCACRGSSARRSTGAAGPCRCRRPARAPAGRPGTGPWVRPPPAPGSRPAGRCRRRPVAAVGGEYLHHRVDVVVGHADRVAGQQLLDLDDVVDGRCRVPSWRRYGLLLGWQRGWRPGGPRAIVCGTSNRRSRGGAEQRARRSGGACERCRIISRALRGRGLVDRRHAGDDGGRGTRPHGRRRFPGALPGAARGRAPSPRSTGRRVRWPARWRPEGWGRATWSCSRSPTGSRPASPSGPPPTWGRWSCRSCTSTGPRRSTTSSGATSPDVIVTADQFGHNDFVATYDVLLADRPSRCGW